jgi:RNA polymerase sigma-70 factor (ECF subfamily)
MGPTDADLCARVLASDDRHAFATLVRRHQPSVRALLRKLTCGHAARADDLAQETFLRAYRALGTYRGGAKLSSWLLRIAYRVFLSDARAAASRPTEELTDDALHAAGGADDALHARHDLERALRVLEPAERAAIALTYGQDLTHEEAAEILDVPLGTLKTRVLGAKQKLRVELAERGDR